MNKEELPASDIWFVRAGTHNICADDFLEHRVVAMGWGIGSISSVECKYEIADRLRPVYPEKQRATLSKWAREIREFNQDMGVGDAVATYEPRSRTYHLGIIRSLLVPAGHIAFCENGNDYVHRVDWLFQVSRDTLPSNYAKDNLDRRSTLHRLSTDASMTLRQLCWR